MLRIAFPRAFSIRAARTRQQAIEESRCRYRLEFSLLWADFQLDRPNQPMCRLFGNKEVAFSSLSFWWCSFDWHPVWAQR
jgi:hypothetical protein